MKLDLDQFGSALKITNTKLQTPIGECLLKPGFIIDPFRSETRKQTTVGDESALKDPQNPQDACSLRQLPGGCSE